MKNRIFALLLAFLLIFGCVACKPSSDDPLDDQPSDIPDKNEQQDPPKTEEPDPEPSVIELFLGNQTDYTIVYDDSDATIAQHAKDFAKLLDHKFFVDIEAVGISEAEDDYGKEIVIGNVRPCAKTVQKQLKGGDFAINVVGDDLVMCATNARLYAYLFEIFTIRFLSKYDNGDLLVSEEQNFLYHASEFASVSYIDYLQSKGKVTAQTIDHIFEYCSFTAEDGTTLPYRLYVPYEYDESKEYPVLIILHGAGERGTDNVGCVEHMLPELFAHEGTPLAEAIVFCPQCPAAPNQWVDTPWSMGNYKADKLRISNELTAVMELLYEIENNYSTDTDRYYVTGLSMGGFGTWDLLMRYPDVFAAGVPICGGADPSYAEVIKDVPIYTVHSTDDPIVPVRGTQAMVEALKAAGSESIVYKELQGFGHGVWKWTAEQKDIWEWLFYKSLADR